MTSHTHPATPLRTVYHHRHRWLFVGLALLMAANASFLTTAGMAVMPVLTVLVALIFWLNSAVAMTLGLFLRIEITPGGITYHDPGCYMIDSPWSNVEGIRDIKFLFGNTVRCVVLRERAARGRTGLAFVIPREYRGRAIPLTNLWERADELEAEFRRYLEANS